VLAKANLYEFVSYQNDQKVDRELEGVPNIMELSTFYKKVDFRYNYL
jgi:hypothetical protein